MTASYHAIFGRPMLAKFMAIPHHTYLIMKMSVPNGILFVLGDIMVSYNCESATKELSNDSVIKVAGTRPDQTKQLCRYQTRPDQQRSWSTKQLCRYQTRSAQPQRWTRVQLSRRFASACPTHPRKSSSGSTSIPNRNSCSPACSGTTLTSSHGVHPICLESLKPTQ
jgi:hypothetical protein